MSVPISRSRESNCFEEKTSKLHGEKDEECHHQTEQTHGLRQSEAQNGVGKELLFQGGIPVKENVISHKLHITNQF